VVGNWRTQPLERHRGARTDKNREVHFPVLAPDPQAANHLALTYVLQILRLDDFELRVVGA
jgi:hypothetical protein